MNAGLAVFLLLVGCFALWRVSLLLFPEKRCRWCGGSGSHRGPLRTVRICGRCRGSGHVPRVGARRDY